MHGNEVLLKVLFGMVSHIAEWLMDMEARLRGKLILPDNLINSYVCC